MHSSKEQIEARIEHNENIIADLEKHEYEGQVALWFSPEAHEDEFCAVTKFLLIDTLKTQVVQDRAILSALNLKGEEGSSSG
jgi:hypothetical protein